MSRGTLLQYDGRRRYYNNDISRLVHVKCGNKHEQS